MRRALVLASRGAGWVNPNPMVGAVLVRDGRIIGEGYHGFFGGPHAEVNAFSAVTEPVDGATLYVTLEPCAHHGKTPPCAELVVDKRISRVVIAMEDPNPLVNGKGIHYLESHGINVETGLLSKEAARLNEGFLKFIRTGMPFVVLKSAMTLDGKIATVTNASRWITGEASRKLVHRMRQQLSAVLVGIDTVLSDDPLLNIRLRGSWKNPLKVVADTHCRIPLKANVLAREPQLAIIATSETADPEKMKAIERLGAQVLPCPLKNGRVDLGYLMHSLAAMEIDSVMIEGGSTIAYAALQDGIVDKVVSFIAPKILGGREAPTPVGGAGIRTMEEAIQVREMKTKKIGRDIMIEGWI